MMISDLIKQRDMLEENIEKAVFAFVAKCPKEFYPPYSRHVSEDMTSFEIIDEVTYIRIWFYQGEGDYDSILIPEYIFEASADVIETYLKAKAEEERIKAEQAKLAEQQRLETIQNNWDREQYKRLKRKFEGV